MGVAGGSLPSGPNGSEKGRVPKQWLRLPRTKDLALTVWTADPSKANRSPMMLSRGGAGEGGDGGHPLTPRRERPFCVPPRSLEARLHGRPRSARNPVGPSWQAVRCMFGAYPNGLGRSGNDGVQPGEISDRSESSERPATADLGDGRLRDDRLEHRVPRRIDVRSCAGEGRPARAGRRHGKREHSAVCCAARLRCRGQSTTCPL